MAKISIESEATSVEHAIEYNGEDFVLRCDGGTWRLFNCISEQVAYIGKRKEWTAALADALERLSDETLVRRS